MTRVVCSVKLVRIDSPTTELPDPKAQIQGSSAGTVKLAKPH